MIKITLYTPKGIEYEGESNSLVIMDQNTGSFGVLENHIPVISTISRGYIMVKENEKELYLAVEGAVFKFENNTASIVSETLAKGNSKEEAINALIESNRIRKEQNKERNVELALAENELKKQIKKTGAGHL